MIERMGRVRTPAARNAALAYLDTEWTHFPLAAWIAITATEGGGGSSRTRTTPTRPFTGAPAARATAGPRDRVDVVVGSDAVAGGLPGRPGTRLTTRGRDGAGQSVESADRRGRRGAVVRREGRRKAGGAVVAAVESLDRDDQVATGCST